MAFLGRRLARILPSYWLASLLLALVLWLRHKPPEMDALAKSLFFIPYLEGDTGLLALPTLWPGWTLFYELVFYAVFGLTLGLRREAAVLCAGLALCLLVAAGIYVAPAQTTVFAMTRPVVLLFVPGMVLGWLFAARVYLPGWVRVGAALACVAAYLAWPTPPDAAQYGFVYAASSGLPAALLAAALLGGPLHIPYPAFWNRLGDLSFSIYLLHVPVAWIGISLFRGRVNLLGPWGYLIPTLIAVYVLGYCHFRYVEKPLTQWLYRFVPDVAERQAATGQPLAN